MKKLILIILLMIPMSLVSEDIDVNVSVPDICFTKNEIGVIDKQLEKNKKVIIWQAKRWKDLVETQPKIQYKVSGPKVIVQRIEFPVKKDKPLVYRVNLEIDTSKRKYTYFPLLINLGLMVESGAIKFHYLDPKLGFQFAGLYPTGITFIKGLGFHALVGIQSAGLSISWGWLKRPIENLRFHVYGGVAYTGKETFGGGITLNF